MRSWSILITLLLLHLVSAIPVIRRFHDDDDSFQIRQDAQDPFALPGLSSTIGSLTPTSTPETQPIVSFTPTPPTASSPANTLVLPPTPDTSFLSNRSAAAAVFTIIGLILAGAVIALAFIIFRCVGHRRAAPSAEFATPESKAAFRGWFPWGGVRTGGNGNGDGGGWGASFRASFWGGTNTARAAVAAATMGQNQPTQSYLAAGAPQIAREGQRLAGTSATPSLPRIPTPEMSQRTLPPVPPVSGPNPFSNASAISVAALPPPPPPPPPPPVHTSIAAPRPKQPTIKRISPPAPLQLTQDATAPTSAIATSGLGGFHHGPRAPSPASAVVAAGSQVPLPTPSLTRATTATATMRGPRPPPTPRKPVLRVNTNPMESLQAPAAPTPQPEPERPQPQAVASFQRGHKKQGSLTTPATELLSALPPQQPGSVSAHTYGPTLSREPTPSPAASGSDQDVTYRPSFFSPVPPTPEPTSAIVPKKKSVPAGIATALASARGHSVTPVEPPATVATVRRGLSAQAVAASRPRRDFEGSDDERGRR